MTFTIPNAVLQQTIQCFVWNKISGLWAVPVYNSPISTAIWELISPSVWTDSGTLKVGGYDFNGALSTSSIGLHVLGDRDQVWRCKGIRMGWVNGPAASVSGWCSAIMKSLDDIRFAQPNYVINSAIIGTGAFNYNGSPIGAAFMDGNFSSRFMYPLVTINNVTAAPWEFDSYWLDLEPAGIN